jgi:hypothetical protein
MPYTFLFSYDRDTRTGCEKKNRRTGETYNLIDDFYTGLRDLVQSGLGITPDEVGWFDQSAIQISAPGQWTWRRQYRLRECSSPS